MTPMSQGPLSTAAAGFAAGFLPEDFLAAGGFAAGAEGAWAQEGSTRASARATTARRRISMSNADIGSVRERRRRQEPETSLRDAAHAIISCAREIGGRHTSCDQSPEGCP